MRFLIISDLHSNWEAVQAVISKSKGQYDQIVCCGDIVGYGADPDVVTEWVRQNVELVIRGNHDKACAGLEDLEWFNPLARISAVWTQETTDPRNIAYLRELAPGPLAVDGFQIVHGSPLDEDGYLISEFDAAQTFPYLDTTCSFFGHTHLQGGFRLNRNGVNRLPKSSEDRLDLALEPDWYYLINPGSVGQPRDGDPRAAYAIYDSEQSLVSYFRVSYDLKSAQKKIVKAGLPELLARRLESGS